MNEAAADAMNPHKGRAYAAAGAGVGGRTALAGRQGRSSPLSTGRPYAHAATSRDAALDTLRAFVTVLVVAHHSVLAYALISPAAAPRSPQHPWLAGVPIVDSHRLILFDLFALFNDTFFMSLMFLLSGLFVGPSLAHKGGGSFLRDRALRLGAPFVVMAVMAPLAYYPAYRAWAANPGALAFWREWLSLGIWPSGPLWFVAALLGFDVIAAALYRIAPDLLQRAGRLASGRPPASDGLVRGLHARLGGRLSAAEGHIRARELGGRRPNFRAEQPRPALFGLFPGGRRHRRLRDRPWPACARRPPGRRWCWWTLRALGLFASTWPCSSGWRRAGPASGLPPLARQMIFGLGFVLCCGAISFAMLAVFRRFANARTPVLTSLSRNAYGIYLLHYGFVMWLQYALLPAALPGGRQGRRRAVCRARGKLDGDRRLAADSGRRQSDLG